MYSIPQTVDNAHKMNQSLSHTLRESLS